MHTETEQKGARIQKASPAVEAFWQYAQAFQSLDVQKSGKAGGM
jgi:hypothetical protein